MSFINSLKNRRSIYALAKMLKMQTKLSKQLKQ